MTTQPSFADLGVGEPMIQVLAACGIVSPFPIQVETLPDTLAGRDALGRGKTGSGKTLAFCRTSSSGTGDIYLAHLTPDLRLTGNLIPLTSENHVMAGLDFTPDVDDRVESITEHIDLETAIAALPQSW